MPNKTTKKDSIKFQQTVSAKQFNILLKVQQEKSNFLHIQDVVRAALNYYFESHGYKSA